MIQNKKTELYVALLMPSAIGVVLYTFVSGLIIILNQFSFIQHYLQIPDDVNFMRIFLDWIDKVANTLLGESRIEVIVVGAFWAVVGLGVYVLLRGVARFISELSEGVDERRYIWPRGSDRNLALREAAERSAFHVFAFIGLLIVMFGPLARLLRGPVVMSMTSSNTVMKYLVWFVLTWLTLHACVVLVRLLVLKPRLFN